MLFAFVKRYFPARKTIFGHRDGIFNIQGLVKEALY